MDRSAPLAGRLRSGRLVMLSLVAVLAVGACGSSAAGGTGDGGGAAQSDVDKIIAESQRTIGTSMVSGELAGDTITLTLADGFGAGGAKLFMCANLKVIREMYDSTGTIKMVMVHASGEVLAQSDDC